MTQPEDANVATRRSTMYGMPRNVPVPSASQVGVGDDQLAPARR